MGQRDRSDGRADENGSDEAPVALNTGSEDERYTSDLEQRNELYNSDGLALDDEGNVRPLAPHRPKSIAHELQQKYPVNFASLATTEI